MKTLFLNFGCVALFSLSRITGAAHFSPNEFSEEFVVCTHNTNESEERFSDDIPNIFFIEFSMK